MSESPAKKEHKPDDIVGAKRLEGFGTVYTDYGEWSPGGIIPMRYAEASSREDCEVAPLPKAEKESK